MKIAAVGDICPGDKSIMGLGVMSLSKKNELGFAFDKVRDILKDNDIVLGNFEGLLSKEALIDSNHDLTFCGIPDFATGLADAGFNLLTMANNHVLEHGPKYFNETVDILKKAGIKICGLRDPSCTYYSKPVYMSVKGKKLGFLGYNWVGTDKFENADQYIAQSRDSLVNYSWHNRDTNEISDIYTKNKNVHNDIRKLKNEVDLVILLPHWGYEFVHLPPYNLTLEARSFIESGANIIIGSHPHVIQAEERINDSLIFYSLGNFIFDMRYKPTRLTTILNLSIENSVNFEYWPMVVNKWFQPEQADLMVSKKIRSLLNESRDVLQNGTQKEMMNDNLLYKAYENNYRKMKIRTVIAHFLALRQDWRVIYIINRKIKNFFGLISAKFSGNNIRW